MDRKEFLARSFKLCVGCGAMATLAPVVTAEQEPSAQETTPPEATFFDADWQQEWIADLMKTIDSQLEKQQRIALMNANGRACANRTSRQTIKQFTGNLDGLLQNFRDQLSGGLVEQQDGAVSVSWDVCYCPIVSNGPAIISDTYCHCSAGWFLEIFEMVLGKPVEVEINESIKRGDKRCKVTVRY